MNDREWDLISDGIRVFGTGLREGHQSLQSIETFDFTNSETFIKWMAVGGNLDEYATSWPFLISAHNPEASASTSVACGGFFTTDHQYWESAVVPGKTWFYTRIVVDAEGVYTAVTSTID